MSAAASELLERDERTLHAYHDGELGALARWRFERRLARSPALRRDLVALVELSDWLSEAHSETSPDLWSAIALRLPALDAQRSEANAGAGRGASWLLSHLRPIATAAATAALAIAVVVGIMGDDAAEPPVISWLDTGGRSVMVLEGDNDATIVWLLDTPAHQFCIRC